MLITTNAHFTRIPIIGVRHLDSDNGKYTEITMRDEADAYDSAILFIPGHVYIEIGEVINGDS